MLSYAVYIVRFFLPVLLPTLFARFITKPIARILLVNMPLIDMLSNSLTSAHATCINLHVHNSRERAQNHAIYNNLQQTFHV
jgi:hypothetical protein